MKNEKSRAVRLDKFLADTGAGTRSGVKEKVRKGRVAVNGCIETHPERKIDPETDRVELDQKEIRPRPDFVYYLLNKPAGYVSATEDARERTVLELVPGGRKDLFPVGRLDKDTEGLLLITNDGMLSHSLLSPGKHVEKTYYVETERPVTPEEAQKLENGVDIGEKRPTLPAKAELLSPQGGTGRMRLTICEGKYHQVKRMLEAVENRVTYLKRVSMGGLALPEELPAGEFKELRPEEIQSIFPETRKA